MSRRQPAEIVTEYPLPPGRLRKCGEAFRQDHYWLRSGGEEMRRLVGRCNLRDDSSLLDIGCGVGRLPLALRNAHWPGTYHGLDVDGPAIDWCSRNLGSERFTFTHLPVYNRRYNMAARRKMLGPEFRLPVPESSFDVIYLYSVFTHLEPQEIDVYLGEFARLLREDGRVFLTAFVEPGVADYEENPPDYPPGYRNKHYGPMHRARYNRDYFLSRVRACGLRCLEIDHHAEWDAQSGIYLARGEVYRALHS